ncbi:hypothetical protein [Halobacillus hunanensis]|nr:hypothetical protein [Halobacillus hunanensis]
MNVLIVYAHPEPLLQGLENLPFIPYHPNSHFNEDHRLKEEYK